MRLSVFGCVRRCARASIHRERSIARRASQLQRADRWNDDRAIGYDQPLVMHETPELLVSIRVSAWRQTTNANVPSPQRNRWIIGLWNSSALAVA